MTRAIIAVTLCVAVAEAHAGAGRTSRIEVPLKVSLTGEESDGRATLTAELEIRGRLPTPPVLRLELPAGARLVEGLPEEALTEATDPGKVTRVFVVEGLEGRAATVVAEMVSRGAGARSQASWPRPKEAIRVQPVPEPVPIPPVEIQGVRVEQAIPIGPASK